MGVDTKSLLAFLSEGTSKSVIQPQIAAEIYYRLQSQSHEQKVDLHRFFPYLFGFFLEYECKIVLAGVREMNSIRGVFPENGNAGSGFLSILAHYVRNGGWERAEISLQDLAGVLRNFRSVYYPKYLDLMDIEVIMDELTRQFAAPNTGSLTVVSVNKVLQLTIQELQIAITSRKLALEHKLTSKTFQVTRFRVELISKMSNLIPEKFKELFHDLSGRFSITIPHNDFVQLTRNLLGMCVPNFPTDKADMVVRMMQSDPEVKQVGAIEPREFVIEESVPEVMLRKLVSFSQERLREVIGEGLESVGKWQKIQEYPFKVAKKEEKKETVQTGLLYQMRGNHRLKRLLLEDLRTKTVIEIAKLV